MPDAQSRREIWLRLLPERTRRAISDDEIADMSQRFEVTGGSIRNIVLDACYRALECKDETMTIRHIVASTAREYQKMSRPVTRGDFGRFYDWAIDDVVSPAHASATAGS